MHPIFLQTTAKRITKLTDKAKAAIDEKLETSSKKRKTNDSNTTCIQPKKVRSTQECGNTVEQAPRKVPLAIPTQPTTNGRTVKQAPKVHAAPSRQPSKQAVVCSEEEQLENALNDDAHIIISDDEREGSKGAATDSEEDNEETAEDELSKERCSSSKYQLTSVTERLMKEWNSPIYAFFDPMPVIETINSRRAHAFKCMAKGCKVRIRRFLDKKDARSTGNLRKHVKSCWGDEVLQAADEAKNANEVRMNIVASVLRNGSITASFERKGKGQVTYSHRQHTRTETKWVLALHATRNTG